MKRILALSILWCSLFCALTILPALAGDSGDDCDSYPDVPVNVIGRFDDPDYDYTKNISEIMSLAGNPNGLVRDGIMLGLTRYQPFIDINVATKVINLPDGLSCAKADHVDVTIGYKDVKVYVAKEIPQDSCGFNEIIDHERKHVEANRELLEKYRPIIEDQLETYMKLNGVFREPNYDYAISLLHDKIKELLSSVSDDFNRDSTAIHAQIDSDNETRRINLSCNNELLGIIDNYYQHRPVQPF